MAIIVDLARRIDAAGQGNLLAAAILAMDDQGNVLTGFQIGIDINQVEGFRSVQLQRLPACAKWNGVFRAWPSKKNSF